MEEKKNESLNCSEFTSKWIRVGNGNVKWQLNEGEQKKENNQILSFDLQS